jgi:hypothetical protein
MCWNYFLIRKLTLPSFLWVNKSVWTTPIIGLVHVAEAHAHNKCRGVQISFKENEIFSGHYAVLWRTFKFPAIMSLVDSSASMWTFSRLPVRAALNASVSLADTIASRSELRVNVTVLSWSADFVTSSDNTLLSQDPVSVGPNEVYFLPAQSIAWAGECSGLTTRSMKCLQNRV